MKKVLAIFICSLIVLSSLMTFGCSNSDPYLNDSTFGGVNNQVSEEDVYSFVYSGISEYLIYDGLEIAYEYLYTIDYGDTQNYKNLKDTIKFSFDSKSIMAEGKFLLTANSNYENIREGWLIDQTNAGDNSQGTSADSYSQETIASYLINSQLYSHKVNKTINEKTKQNKNVAQFISETFSNYSVTFNYSLRSFLATYAGKGASYFMEEPESKTIDGEKIEEVEGETRVRIMLSNYQSYGSVVSLDGVFVYNSAKELTGSKIDITVKGENTLTTISSTIKPWQGEIIAPTDLESYI